MKRKWGYFLSSFKGRCSPHRHSSGLALLALAMLALAGCGGGGGGGSDGGQKPDPVVVDLPIAYIERPIPVDEDGNPVFPDVFDQTAFNPGARLILKERATAQAAPVDISSAAFLKENFPVAEYPDGPLYDVKDIAVHPEGNRLVFAMRAPEIPDADEEDQPTWNIWEYHLQTKVLRRIISTDIVAEAGQDVAPRYLPDGRILFASTRQTRSKAILLDDGKPQYSAGIEGNRNRPAYVLHTMKDDGTDIQQITYNQSHDIQPGLLPDGRVFYTRWDHMGDNNNLSFYTVNPDGTNSQIYYGYNSLNGPPADATQSKPRLFNLNTMPDGRIAGILKPSGALLGGDMVVIDAAHFSENARPVEGVSGGSASGQGRISILPVNIREGENEISIHGRFASAYPLYDGTNRLLVSWSQCRLQEPVTNRLLPCSDANLAIPEIREAEPFYGIWIYNTAAQTQQPVVLAKTGFMYTDAVSLEKVAPPTFYRPQIDAQLAQEAVGVLHIRSVYDMDGSFSRYGFNDAPGDLASMAAAPAAQRPARFLRLIKAVSMPDNDTLNFQNTAFGVSDVMREVLGYAPIEPDGSVKVKVPADVAFSIEILDANGRRISQPHNNWLQLRPGEVRQCNGCHDNRNDVAHGRADAEAVALNSGAATSGLSFLNTLRFDALGSPMTPAMGETMAEFAARSTFCLTPGNAASCAPVAQRAPSVDIVFNDEWSDPGVRERDASFEYRYLALADDPALIKAPTSAACMDPDGWNSLCRVIINYQTHIQPLWERSRVVDGQERQCTSCHSRNAQDNAGNTLVQIPAGQLELTRQESDVNSAHITSYHELLSRDLRQVLTGNGAGLTDDIPVCEFAVDEDAIPECTVTLDAAGNPTCEGVADCPFEQVEVTNALLLDAEGKPIPRTRQIGVNASMSANGARASARFFGRFNSFDAATDTVDHRGFLNTSELKLLSEWLDIGAAYYNNPFDSVD